MAYDKANKQVILFGSRNLSPIPETWQWTSATGWKQLNPSHSPPGRTYTSMAYDDATQTIVLFGGQLIGTAASPLTDTWTWDGNDWTQQNPSKTPPATVITSLAYDPLTQTVLGVLDDDPVAKTETWQWDGNTWSQLSPTTAPKYGKQGAGMVFSTSVQVMVLFGTVYSIVGPPAEGSTWTYSAGTWTAHPATGADPKPRMQPGMSAEQTGGAILFGGQGSGYTVYGETWTWNGKWQKRSVVPAPARRSRPLMAYDSTCKLVLMYGGELQTGSSLTEDYDSWAWSGQAWTKLG
jgi:hypothetical protein